MNRQREVIYGLRRKIMGGGEPVRTFIETALENSVHRLVDTHCPRRADFLEWDWESLARGIHELFNVSLTADELRTRAHDDGVMDRDGLATWLHEFAQQRYEERVAEIGIPELWDNFIRDVVLYVIDTHWKDHLYALDHLKEAVGLRGFGQRDPLIEFKRESFQLFEEMLDRMEEAAVKYVYWVQIGTPEKATVKRRVPRRYQYLRPNVDGEAPRAAQSSANTGPESAGTVTTYRRTRPKIGRNDPCPCGSGKKYKKCCMLKEPVSA